MQNLAEQIKNALALEIQGLNEKVEKLVEEKSKKEKDTPREPEPEKKMSDGVKDFIKEKQDNPFKGKEI